MQKKVSISLIIVLIVGGLVFGFLKGNKKETAPKLFKVARGDILQEVSETGTVTPTEELALSFETNGNIGKIYVEEDQKVSRGELLAELDSKQLQIQLSEAKAAKEAAEARLNQLLAGYSKEEIEIAKTAVSNAQTSLADQEQNLSDVKAQAARDLSSVYEDGLNVLDDVYLTTYEALQDVETIYLSYFSGGLDQDGIVVQANRDNIKKELSKQEASLALAKSDNSHQDIDTALSEFKTELSTISLALTKIKAVVDKAIYSNTISSTNKAALETARSNIATAISDITDREQIVFDTKLSNEAKINQAQTKVNTARGALQKARDELALKEAGPREVDIALKKAEVKEAEAKVGLLNLKIAKSRIRSPIEGLITDVKKKRGEMVAAAEPIITLISSAPFQIETDIYEEDISRIRVGQEADINLVAFPEETLKGKVVVIEPAEKLIEDVVYYAVRIDFEGMPKEVNLKSGMTADVVIKTASRENVLTVPASGLIKKDKKFFVKVFKQGEVEEREIEVGLKGDNNAEVISGLREGEEVILNRQ